MLTFSFASLFLYKQLVMPSKQNFSLFLSFIHLSLLDSSGFNSSNNEDDHPSVKMNHKFIRFSGTSSFIPPPYPVFQTSMNTIINKKKGISKSDLFQLNNMLHSKLSSSSLQYKHSPSIPFFVLDKSIIYRRSYMISTHNASELYVINS